MKLSIIHCFMGSVGIQCPLTPLTFSLGEFSSYWDWLWYPRLLPVLASIAFPFAFHISVFFHSLFFTCHWISLVYFSRWRYLHPATNPLPLPDLGTGTGPQWTVWAELSFTLQYLHFTQSFTFPQQPTLVPQSLSLHNSSSLKG